MDAFLLFGPFATIVLHHVMCVCIQGSCALSSLFIFLFYYVGKRPSSSVRQNNRSWSVNITAPLVMSSPIMAPLPQMIGLEFLAFRRHNGLINDHHPVLGKTTVVFCYHTPDRSALAIHHTRALAYLN